MKRLRPITNSLMPSVSPMINSSSVHQPSLVRASTIQLPETLRTSCLALKVLCPGCPPNLSQNRPKACQHSFIANSQRSYDFSYSASFLATPDSSSPQQHVHTNTRCLRCGLSLPCAAVLVGLALQTCLIWASA